jgi:hypothetical protein
LFFFLILKRGDGTVDQFSLETRRRTLHSKYGGPMAPLRKFPKEEFDKSLILNIENLLSKLKNETN